MPRLTDDEFEELRAEARQFAEMRSEYFKLSKQAYRSGDKKQAKILSNQGKKFAQLMEKANKTAADAIFNRNNQNGLADTIDLHGLFVKEAIERLSARVAFVKKGNDDELTVIVGRGLHSQGGPKLKPAVIKYANSNGILHRMDSPNPGCLRFELKSETSAATWRTGWSSESSESSREDFPSHRPPTPQKYHPRVSIPFIRPVPFPEVHLPTVRPYSTPITNAPAANVPRYVPARYVPIPYVPVSYVPPPYVPVSYVPRSQAFYNTTPSPVITRPSSARIPSIRRTTNIDPESLDTEGCNPSKTCKISTVSMFVLVLIVTGALAYFNRNLIK